MERVSAKADGNGRDEAPRSDLVARIESGAARAILDDWVTRVNAVVLVPIGRSGSTFMGSLFDGHPAVAGLPGWFVTNYADWAPPQEREGRREFVRRFTIDNAAGLDGRKSRFLDLLKLPERASANAEPGIDVDRFGALLVRLIDDGQPLSRRRFLCACYLVCLALRGGDPSLVQWLLVHDHTLYEGSLVAFQADFPSMRLLVTTRDPRESWASFRVFEEIKAGGPHVFTAFVAHLRLQAVLATRICKAISSLAASNVRIVDLGVLHIMQDGAMKRLAAWLDIAFLSSLTVSTKNDVAWGGNASDRRATNGFDRQRAVLRYREKLDPHEIEIVEHFLAPLIVLLGYPLERPSRSRIALAATLLLRDPIPQLLSPATTTQTVGQVWDRVMFGEIPPHRHSKAHLLPVKLWRLQRAVRDVAQYFADDARRALVEYRARYTPGSYDVFGVLHDAATGTQIDPACFIRPSETPGGARPLD